MLRLVDLLAVAVDDMRQGGDPRLPLELALVKVTRPASGPLARVDRVPARAARAGNGHRQPVSGASSATEAPRGVVAEPEPAPEPVPVPVGAPAVEVSQLQEAWTRTVLPAVEERGGIPTASLLREAHPADLNGDTLTLEFPPTAQFHLDLAREPKNATLLADALYDVTGRRLELVVRARRGARDRSSPTEEPAGEERDPRAPHGDIDARERES